MIFNKASLYFLLIMTGFLNARISDVDSLIDAAWHSWQKPDYTLAEKQFRLAIEANPTNGRAYFRLALLQNMHEKHQECWETLKQLTDKTSNTYPYISSFWFTLRFRLKEKYEELGVLDYLKELASSSDEQGVLSAQAIETLEEYYRDCGNLEESIEWRKKINAISDWMLIGPFENLSASGYDKVYPPETEFNPVATYEGKSGIPASWFPIVSKLPNTWNDFTRHFGYSNSIFYANTFVYSPVKTKVYLRIGTSGSLKAFLNDELVIEYADENNNDLDTYIAATELQQGWNRFLIKCGYSKIDKCNFLVRITDEHGGALEGLLVSTELKTYPKKPLAPVVFMENSFELFFKNQLELYPNIPENYALLAQLYLRNDKAPEAELLIRSALKKWPRCSLFYILMMEAYIRNEKSNELSELLIKLSAIDDQLPAVIDYKIKEGMQNEEYQLVEELIAQLKKQSYSDQENIYDLEMELLSKKKEIDKLVSLVNQACSQFPYNWQFVNLQALIESEVNRNPEKAINVVKDFLKKRYGLEQLNILASYYLKAGKLDEWEETMNEAIDLSPTATGYVYTMGLVYQLVKNYPKAEEFFNRALTLCPNSSLYWSKLAEVYKATNRLDDARNAYRKSLNFEPQNFDAREALRELEGKKAVFSSFATVDIDSLIRTAPNQNEYQSDNSIILLDDTKRVVFERGASMVSHELLVKPFNTDGIDTWKEYYISYNSYNEQLIIEKAVTIKKDGTEVKADIDEGHIVFKSMEPNDFIYLKWKLKNYYNGMLAKHFWDTHYFNGFLPVLSCKYSLIVPEGVQFTHRTTLTPDNPVTRKVDDGILYEWELKNEPAVRYEYGMPGLNDVGKMLFISSLPSWDYVANWYSDLARTKTQTTFEIKDEITNLFNGKNNLSEEAKVKTVYDFITNNIRYNNVPFRQSAHIPQSARDVLVHRIGDCKDVATLCIAMLNEVGIKAHYVLVNTKDEGMNQNIPPSISFNHCIVGVEMKNGIKYIDLTASNFSIGSVPNVVNGAFALDIKKGEPEPKYLEPAQFNSNSLIRVSKAILNEDNSLLYNCSSSRSGNYSYNLRERYRGKNEEECKKLLGELISNDYSNAKVTEISLKNIDSLDQILEDSHSYLVPQFISEAGGFKLMRIPWSDNLAPIEPLSYEKRTYPFLLGTVNDTIMETIHITLPKGYTLSEKPTSIKLTNSIGEYTLSIETKKSVLTACRSFIIKKSVVNPEEYIEYKKFYNEALHQDNRQFLLKNEPDLKTKGISK